MERVREEIAELELTRDDLTYWEVNKAGFNKHIHLDKSGVKKILSIEVTEGVTIEDLIEKGVKEK